MHTFEVRLLLEDCIVDRYWRCAALVFGHTAEEALTRAEDRARRMLGLFSPEIEMGEFSVLDVEGARLAPGLASLGNAA